MTTFVNPNFLTVFLDNEGQFRKLDQRLSTVLDGMASNIAGILDRGIRFADNVDCAFVSYTTNATPDTEDVIPHTLGKIPSYFLVVDLDKGGVIYRSNLSTKTDLYLKCSVASMNAILMVF